MKIAPIVRAIGLTSDVTCSIIHTGQHYDANMSDVFFQELGIPHPHHHLGAGSGSHAEQTARIMVKYEAIVKEETPDLVMVVGDVNSTLACSIVAKKECLQVAHVEAGLRSRDLAMPEEINRMVTDAITDLFFVTEPQGRDNLLQEGKPADKIHFVGHVMIDNLYYQLAKLDGLGDNGFPSAAFKQQNGNYGVVTLHRPSNVDEPEVCTRIMGALSTIADQMPLIFPIHPRTKKNLDRFGIIPSENIHMTAPLPYMEFLNLFKDAAVVLTDSGGIQEETTALGVPCLTVRENTERPITVEQGTNELVGTSAEKILSCFDEIKRGEWKRGQRPDLWDGRAAERIVDVLRELA